jgi:hypothetical protein
MSNIIWNEWGSPVVDNCLSELEGEIISSVDELERIRDGKLHGLYRWCKMYSM